MGIKSKLVIVNFLQFFVWGAWLLTIANYWFGNKGWSGSEFGAVFATMGFASLFMPTIAGIIADRWINTERLLGIMHLLYAISLFFITKIDNPNSFFWMMFLAMVFYMPTIALNNSVSYSVLKKYDFDIIKDFPPIRVWGTIGFITAMWITNLTGSKANENQFLIAITGSVVLALFSFFLLPKCPPQKHVVEKQNLLNQLGLGAFKLFSSPKMALFFIFSMFLGAALQLTNAYGDVFLDEFKFFPKYADSFVIKYSTIIMSISQISETLFILAIPFFLKRYGIKKVMLISMLAWVLRFGLFSFGNPTDGLWMIMLSCIVYGMAFDFFNVSGSMFVESSTTPKNRSSAQGLFMMMTNGVGAVLGSLTSGWMIDKYFTKSFGNINSLSSYLETTADNKILNNFLTEHKVKVDTIGNLSSEIQMKDWSNIWLTFAIYALIIAIAFNFMFKHKHDPNQISDIQH